MYKRKAPATPSLSPLQQLSKLCNACIDDLPFQVHNAVALQRQMQQRDSAVYASFAQRATPQRFVPRRLVDDGSNNNTKAATLRVRAGATLYTLPLPRHFVDARDCASDYTPRAFYHHSAVTTQKDADKDADDAALPSAALARVAQARAPRCGASGLFFAREEVVDNLCAAADDLSFQSPFWLRHDHPALASGFLKVKDDSEAVCISLTASVVSITAVEPFDAQLLHPSLRGKCDARSCTLRDGDGTPRGMNALSGFVTRNPYVQQLPHHGVWLSLDQLLHHNIELCPPCRNGSGAPPPPMALVEVDTWELYNADQLVTPGRLALRQCASPRDGDTVFQPL